MSTSPELLMRRPESVFEFSIILKVVKGPFFPRFPHSTKQFNKFKKLYRNSAKQAQYFESKLFLTPRNGFQAQPNLTQQKSRPRNDLRLIFIRQSRSISRMEF